MPDLRFLSSARRKPLPTSWSRAARAGGHRLIEYCGMVPGRVGKTQFSALWPQQGCCRYASSATASNSLSSSTSSGSLSSPITSGLASSHGRNGIQFCSSSEMALHRAAKNAS